MNAYQEMNLAEAMTALLQPEDTQMVKTSAIEELLEMETSLLSDLTLIGMAKKKPIDDEDEFDDEFDEDDFDGAEFDEDFDFDDEDEFDDDDLFFDDEDDDYYEDDFF